MKDIKYYEDLIRMMGEGIRDLINLPEPETYNPDSISETPNKKQNQDKPDDATDVATGVGHSGSSPETSGFETLSLKIQNAWEGYKGNIDVEDVKEAVRRLMELDMGEFIANGIFLDGMFHEEIKEIVGSDLI